ncbi:MAG: hypothetical protein IGS38_09795 [Synechococcales cyanobacterium M58_A2018_015]|nr:hypothetical protein [Synechococcales cyanobacterium M58_A2018_015]
MRDRSDRYQVHDVPALTPPKRLGTYLVDAGLLTADQINVALNDQQATGMRFGEIIVARGWLKEKTVEWIVEKVIEPERRAWKRREQAAWKEMQNAKSAASQSVVSRSTPADAAASARGTGTSDATPKPKPFVRREAPITKPLPSVNSTDTDVKWVG